MYYIKQDPNLQTSKCLYHTHNKSHNPHTHQVFKPDYKPKISNNILECIGNTPIVRLNKIPKSEGVECEILAKCEFLNPAGSIKDRIAKRMVEDAERTGKLKPGMQLFEPTTGNTGIALSLVSAVKEYPLTIFMTEKMSTEKEDVMTALGCNVVRCPDEAGHWDEDSLYS